MWGIKPFKQGCCKVKLPIPLLFTKLNASQQLSTS